MQATSPGSFDRRFWLWLLVSIAGVIVAYRIYYPFSPAGRQAANMDKARLHAPIVESLLRKEPRFKDINVGEGSMEDGCLCVSGAVYAEIDLDDLKKLVISTSPPIKVVYRVMVFPPDTTLP